MKIPPVRRRVSWRYDLVFDIEAGRPVATDGETGTVVLRVTDAHLERRRRRWRMRESPHG